MEVMVLKLIKNHPREAVALFFLALLLIGFATVGSYGRAWDEPSEMRILRMALKEYDALLPFHTPYSDYLQDPDILRISESVERDHGICLYYPLFWAFASDAYSVQQLTVIWRCHTWGIFVLGLWALYCICRHMGFSRPLSCTGVLMLFLSPRFFAEGHYNNKDIALMTLVLVLLWQTARMLKKPDWKRGLCFALCAGLCTATRVVGAAFCGLFGLMIVLHLGFTKRLNRRTLATGAGVLAASVLFYCLFTPSFLADPPGFIEYVLKNAVGFSRWHGNLLFFGRVIPCASEWPPRSYLPAFIAVTTPVWMLLLLAVGSIAVFRRIWRGRLSILRDASSLLSVTALVSWFLPLLGLVALRSLVYNGWRHVYFLYGPMVLCMTAAVHHLCRLRTRRLTTVLLCACLLLNAAGIAVNHPMHYAYYNCLAPSSRETLQFEPDWWNVSCYTALSQLLEKTNGPITIGASDLNTRSGLSHAAVLAASDRVTIIRDISIETPQYLMVNEGYGAMAGFVPSADLVPVVTLEAYGMPVNTIYQTTGSETP